MTIDMFLKCKEKKEKTGRRLNNEELEIGCWNRTTDIEYYFSCTELSG